VDPGDPRRGSSGYGKCNGSEPEAGSSLFDADSDSDSYRNCHSDRYGNGDSDSHGDRYFDGAADGDANSDSHGQCNRDVDPSTDGDPNPDPGHLARHDHGSRHNDVHWQHATHLHG
jgi:hypothetical protein